MHSRAARSILLALLLIAGLAGGSFVWQTERRVQALEERRRSLDAIVERLGPAVAGIAAAQQAYVDYGLRDEASFLRVGALLDQITTDAAGLRSRDYSGDGAARLEEFWAALSALTAAEAQATAALTRGDALAAADALFGASRPQVATLSSQLRGFHASETNGLRMDRASLTTRSWMATGGVALLWVIGLFALVRLPHTPRHEEAALSQPRESPALEPVAAVVPPAAPSTPAPETIDLTATADLCTGITQLTDTVALPGVLDRATQILDARGIIVWMGAGDELFAAAAGGYDPAVIGRLRPIRRAAENATAAAWRLGEIRTVAGDNASLGAIVAPMFGGRDCIGVLAAEVRSGRERDAATQAATAIIAAQLAGILAAWPAASGAASSDAGAAPHAPVDSDRQAAAS